MVRNGTILCDSGSIMAYNLYIGLTKSDLSTQYWVALSDKRPTLFISNIVIIYIQISAIHFYLIRV